MAARRRPVAPVGNDTIGGGVLLPNKMAPLPKDKLLAKVRFIRLTVASTSLVYSGNENTRQVALPNDNAGSLFYVSSLSFSLSAGASLAGKLNCMILNS